MHTRLLRTCAGLVTATALALCSVTESCGQSIWDGSESESWSDPLNWLGNELPTSTSDVEIPVDRNIQIDNGDVTVASLTFDALLGSTVQIQSDDGYSLRVNGPITSDAPNQQSFILQVIAGADATYTGGAGEIGFYDLSIGTHDIFMAGFIEIQSFLALDINSLTDFGFIGVDVDAIFDVDGATINVGGSYTGNEGDTFDLIDGNVFGINVNDLILPTLSLGLEWDTDEFESDGKLTVVAMIPEPAVAAFLGGGLVLLGVARRRASRR